MIKKFTVLAVLLAACAFACGCKRGVNEDPGIDQPKLVEQNPAVAGPSTSFPTQCQQADEELNKFVNAVLKSCEEGDYDKFCRFLGTLEAPPSIEGFKRLWSGIREISVRSIRSTNASPPEYFVHAVVRLRQPDTQKRTERDMVLRIFREMDQFRISGAPKDLAQKILTADSQPASAPEGEGSHEPASAETAPATGA